MTSNLNLFPVLSRQKLKFALQEWREKHVIREMWEENNQKQGLNTEPA